MQARTVHRCFARLLIGLLLLGQLAVAAHACSVELPVALSHADVALSAVQTNDGTNELSAWHVDQAESVLSSVCMRHCQDEQAAIPDVAGAVPTVALLAASYLLHPFASNASGDLHRMPEAFVAPPADPPHTILHCCLQI